MTSPRYTAKCCTQVEAVGLADPGFFDIFSFPFVKGNPDTALTEHYSVILTEKMAKKYFGNDDPIGKTLTLNNEVVIQVTGVMVDVPTQFIEGISFFC